MLSVVSNESTVTAPFVTIISPSARVVAASLNAMVIGIGSALVGLASDEDMVVIGPVMSIMITCASEAGDVLPAGSCCVAVRECVPSCRFADRSEERSCRERV